MEKLLTEKELKNRTRVMVGIDNDNIVLGTIVGVATVDLFAGFQTFIIKPDDTFPNEIYPYECFVALNSQIELLKDKEEMNNNIKNNPKINGYYDRFTESFVEI